MPNWKIYQTEGVENVAIYGGPTWFQVNLDEYVEYADKYEKRINILDWSGGSNVCGSLRVYVEIDLDKTKSKNSNHLFSSSSNVYRKVPWELVATRVNILNASSVSATALAINREGMDRVDRGEQATFTYQMEENGIKHTWIYKRN